MSEEKPASSRDVAKEAGVSQATVSYVLNNTKGVTISSKTCNAVNEAIRKLDYHPNLIARSMKLKKSMSIGVVTDRDVTSYGFIKTLEGLKDSLAGYNYSITLCSNPSAVSAASAGSPGSSYSGLSDSGITNSGLSDSGITDSGAYDLRIKNSGASDSLTNAEHIRYFESSRIDGVVFLYADVDNEQTDILVKKNMPFVIINSNNDRLEIPGTVGCDLFPGMNAAIRHLINSGIRKFGYILTSNRKLNSRKFKCFKNVLETNGGKIDDCLVITCRNNEADLLNALENVTALPGAFICDTPNVGYYLLRYLASIKTPVPEIISIVAIGASGYFPFSYPPMSSIEPPLYTMGMEGAEMIMKNIYGSLLMKNRDAEASVPETSQEAPKLAWTFVNRGSCRK